jgi:hypothetical protein
MAELLKKGDQGPRVREVQTLLVDGGFLTDEEVTGTFDNETHRAIRTFQSQNLDENGHPLTVDGRVGELTWWSLHNPKPSIVPPSAIDFTRMPPESAGGSPRGRAALAAAIAELNKRAGEVGGNNRGPFVRTYLNGLASEGNPWCAGFVSFCFSHASPAIPFNYSVGARDILAQFKAKGWANKPGSGYVPGPGDVVVWWREQFSSTKGHIGIVHQVHNGFLYTIEGNKSPNVQGFSYVFSRMDKLLGFGHVPDV